METERVMNSKGTVAFKASNLNLEQGHAHSQRTLFLIIPLKDDSYLI